jgi:acyl dehydratase
MTSGGMTADRRADVPAAGGARYLEDYAPGAVHTAGAITVTEIIDFARRYDPQPMHIDPGFAARGRFGGLIASGWHTGAMMMRLYADHFLSPASSLASPGLDELRWHLPVRPGDVLSLRVTILEARSSRKNPEQGVVRSLVEVLNQTGAVVMSLKPVSFVRRRPAPETNRAGGDAGQWITGRSITDR